MQRAPGTRPANPHRTSIGARELVPWFESLDTFSYQATLCPRMPVSTIADPDNSTVCGMDIVGARPCLARIRRRPASPTAPRPGLARTRRYFDERLRARHGSLRGRNSRLQIRSHLHHLPLLFVEYDQIFASNEGQTVERYRIFAFTTFYRADSMASPLRKRSSQKPQSGRWSGRPS